MRSHESFTREDWAPTLYNDELHEVFFCRYSLKVIKFLEMPKMQEI
jgi:hypothetical protein